MCLKTCLEGVFKMDMNVCQYTTLCPVWSNSIFHCSVSSIFGMNIFSDAERRDLSMILILLVWSPERLCFKMLIRIIMTIYFSTV